MLHELQGSYTVETPIVTFVFYVHQQPWAHAFSFSLMYE